MRAVLDLTDAAFYLHTTIEALRELIKQRKVPYGRRGKKIFFVIDDLNEWIRGQVIVSTDEALTKGGHPAKISVGRFPRTPKTPVETQGSEPVLGLVRGPKGRNRERLAKG